MPHQDETPVNINPDKQTAETNRMHMQPGELDDIENASAFANRTDQQDTTSLRPERAQLGQQNSVEAGATARAGHTSDAASDVRAADGRTDPPENDDGLTSAADPMR